MTFMDLFILVTCFCYSSFRAVEISPGELLNLPSLNLLFTSHHPLTQAPKPWFLLDSSLWPHIPYLLYPKNCKHCFYNMSQIHLFLAHSPWLSLSSKLHPPILLPKPLWQPPECSVCFHSFPYKIHPPLKAQADPGETTSNHDIILISCSPLRAQIDSGETYI